jgi:hypothetical protein
MPPKFPKSDEDLSFRLKLLFWAVASACAFLTAWGQRFVLDGDTVSYLDMGDAYLRGDWKMAINAYWSALYSLLIAIPQHLFRIPKYWESTAVQVVNWLCFLFALACFEHFLSVLIRRRFPPESEIEKKMLPGWAVRIMAYAMFLFSTVVWLPQELGTPDLLVEGLVFLVFAYMIKLRTGDTRWICFATLGLLLGIGYLTKAAMFPMAFVFLATGFVAGGRSRRAATGTLLAAFLFAAISGPMIYALSKEKGRLTFGDSARINYAMHVNGLPRFFHWQGVGSEAGFPLHPTRRLLDTPPLYEFGTPVGGSYPPWYDPSYWWDGVVIHIHAWRQILVLEKNLRFYCRMAGQQAEFPAALLAFCLLTSGILICVRSVGKHWHLWLPALAGLLMYAAVVVETRYIEGYWIVLWLCLFSGLAIPDWAESRKFIRGVTLAVIIVTGVRAVSGAITGMHEAEIVTGATAINPYAEVATSLNQTGIQPGDKVASIVVSFDTYWARLAGVSIVAEIPESGSSTFWESGPEAKANVYEAISHTGAKAIVSNTVPRGLEPAGWKRIGENGDFYVYLLAVNGAVSTR